jgi:hypothetical protein
VASRKTALGELSPPLLLLARLVSNTALVVVCEVIEVLLPRSVPDDDGESDNGCRADVNDDFIVDGLTSLSGSSFAELWPTAITGSVADTGAPAAAAAAVDDEDGDDGLSVCAATDNDAVLDEVNGDAVTKAEVSNVFNPSVTATS